MFPRNFVLRRFINISIIGGFSVFIPIMVVNAYVDRQHKIHLVSDLVMRMTNIRGDIEEEILICKKERLYQAERKRLADISRDINENKKQLVALYILTTKTFRNSSIDTVVDFVSEVEQHQKYFETCSKDIFSLPYTLRIKSKRINEEMGRLINYKYIPYLL